MKPLVCLMIATMFPMVAAAQKAAKDKPAAPKADKGAAMPAPPPPSPEVKQTVDAFVGTWTFEGTVTGMGPAPIKVKETVVCKKAAGGRVAACSGKGPLPGGGTYEDSALVTWSDGDKAVRFVGMSSMGEVHDHKCTWKDDKNLTCDPLSTTEMGNPVTVDLHMTWNDPKTISMSEMATAKDGSKSGFEGTGKRK